MVAPPGDRDKEGSSNDQMRRYLPRPPSEIQDNMSSMFSSIVRHKRQVFTFPSSVQAVRVTTLTRSTFKWEVSGILAQLSNLTFL